MPSRISSVLWVISIAAITFICWPLMYYFLADDFLYIPQSPKLQYVYRTAFRPVSDLSLFLNFILFQKQAWGYHLFNLLIHFASTAIVYRFTERLLSIFQWNQAPIASAASMTALLFLVYPFHAEPILWIVGRGGSLVTLFLLLALLPQLKKQVAKKDVVISMLWFIPALLVYESAWVFPFILIFLGVCRHKDHGYRLKEILPVLLGSIMLVGLHLLSRKWLFDDYIGSPYLNPQHELGVPLPTMLYNYATGICRSLVPSFASSVRFVLISAIAGILFIFLLLRSIKKSSSRWLFLFLFLSWLISLTPIALLGINTHNSESERLLYLPSAFVVLLLGLWVSSIQKTRVKVVSICLIVILSIYLFAASAFDFQVASEANKTALSYFGKLNGTYKAIKVYNLPQHYRGGFMFRLGFEEALHWLAPQLSFDTLMVETKLTYMQPVEIQVPRKNLAAPGKAIADTLLISWDNNLLTATEK